MNELAPHRIVHPAKIFANELQARAETTETLAAKTGIHSEIWQRTLEGCEIDEPLVIALDEAWGIPAQFWLNLWVNYHGRMISKNKPRRVAGIMKVKLIN